LLYYDAKILEDDRILVLRVPRLVYRDLSFKPAIGEPFVYIGEPRPFRVEELGRAA
jgi:hypothetical protein